ncbi:hypothetical protein Tdes44962_MAKER04527 [Teratosphaeria destructans]|uniref:Uncharacterized protein n=1 Tax=Teratosphaeria destructans TaxID=418781 RepID=A0A9W7SM15_9PEZI|nr:hypothetical protein Tdes44962_MAKER04527 [Teratosphaeria destructans]
MSVQSPSFATPPSDKDTPTQDRGIFHQEAQKHQSHHYMRQYGGQVANVGLPFCPLAFSLRYVVNLCVASWLT